MVDRSILIMMVVDRSILIVGDMTLVWRSTMDETLTLELERLIILSLLPLHSYRFISHLMYYCTIVLHLLSLILHLPIHILN